MPSITEGELTFNFPHDWDASKFDEWSFYRGQFSRIGDAEVVCKNCDEVVRCAACKAKRIAGTRGVDILAIDPASVCWHIEIKDYRLTRVTSLAVLADAVALKVRDTIACLVAARLNAATNEVERELAERALQCPRMRIVLHLEVPPTRSSLSSPMSLRANVCNRLKQLVKAIDARPLVVSIGEMGNLAWSVTQV